MRPTFAKAPTLAWLLVALTCFLTGMAVVEGRHQTVVLPVPPTVGVVVTVEVAFRADAAPQAAATAPLVPGSRSGAPPLADGLPHPEP